MTGVYDSKNKIIKKRKAIALKVNGFGQMAK